MSQVFLNMLRANANARPDRPALVSERGILTYEALVDLAERAAEYFRGSLADGTPLVGISIADEVQHLVASLGLLAAGVDQITLPTHESVSARTLEAQRTGVTHVLLADGRARLSGTSAVQWPGVDDLPPTSSGSAYSDREPLLLLNTTGTSGGTDFVPFTEWQIAAQAGGYAEYADEVLLRLAPVEYNTSKRHRLYSLWHGGTNIFRPQGSLATIIGFGAAHGLTCMDVSRMHLAEILALEDPAPLRTVKLRPGGAEVPHSLRRRIMDEITPNLYVRYAATECGAIAMAGPGDHDGDASCGKPIAGVEVEVVNDNDVPVPVGHIGEIRLKAPGMATGYVGNPKKTTARFRDGWFYPGDLGRLRGDGQLIVAGRKDDMMILNGINIFPSAIEQVLELHPDVTAAAVIALASPVHGQIPVAAIEMRAGGTGTVEEVMAYARERLALRAPRRIVVVDRLPRNEQGKILKREIREKFVPKR